MLARVFELLEKRRFVQVVRLRPETGVALGVAGRDHMYPAIVRRMRGCMWVARRLALVLVMGVHGVVVSVYWKR